MVGLQAGAKSETCTIDGDFVTACIMYIEQF